MRLPNKLYHYNDTVLRDMVEILLIIKEPIEIYSLYSKVKKKIFKLDRFIEAIDCLFMVNKINLDERTNKIYVVRS